MVQIISLLLNFGIWDIKYVEVVRQPVVFISSGLMAKIVPESPG